MNSCFVNLWIKVHSRLSEEEGQDLVEYALIIALIALGCTVGLNGLASSIQTAFTNIGTNLTA
jgi:pilus assembly protein Flp/PilA